METRQHRGLAIAALCRITQKFGHWSVPSQTGNGYHRVHVGPETFDCTCGDFENTAKKCKHIYAVEYVIQREAAGEDSTPIPEEDLPPIGSTVAPRPTYKQDWKAYNAAQTNEKRHFAELLRDLCRNVQEPPPRPGPGRPRLPLADLVFACAYKVYSTVSARRFMCDLSDAQERGFIDKVPHFTAIAKALEMPELTPILRALIVESSRPLASLESDFAVDSSGFSTSRFVRWYDEKYGRIKSAHEWVKVHLMCGVRTNVVTAVEILDKLAGDAPQFPALVRATAKTFKMREVSADKGYVGFENSEVVAEFGATPYIAYKSNATGERGGVYEKMYHLFCLNREEFLTHYHKRSNIESTFSMVKAKFGDSIRSKTEIAMANEVYCKILGHNICCVIQSMYELGVNPAFWPEAAPVANTGEAPTILRMVR